MSHSTGLQVLTVPEDAAHVVARPQARARWTSAPGLARTGARGQPRRAEKRP